jgi:D-alanyl-D-alanine carboxypeptidase
MKNRFIKRVISLSLIITSFSVCMPQFANIAYADNVTTTDSNNNSTNNNAITTTSNPNSSVWPQAPEISSGSAILIDADTGAILYEKDAYEKCYPASTTKILTGLLTIENSRLDDIVTFSSAAANSVTWEDASLATKAGEEYTVEQALYGLLLYSANEIAYGLAEHVGGTLSNFVDMMNKRAKELGAVNTHFANASGLYNPDHYTTAYDMAMIAKGCYNNSTFVSIDSTSTSYTIGPTNLTSQSRTFKHRHQMLANRPYYYEYCKGGKTGFTDESGCTLVTFAEKDNMRLICVCFKSGDNERFIDTRTLFDWGFDNFQKVTISGEAISSLFSSSNYYNSNVFGKYILSSNLNASTLTIPTTASSSDIHLKVADNSEVSNENNSYSTNVNFTLADNIVGSTILTLSSDINNHADSKLPYLTSETANEDLSAKWCFSINIYILIVIAIAIIALITYMKQKNNRTYRRRSSVGRRNLHF